MTKKTHPLARRLAARKAVALLTGSHASLGLVDRMSIFEGFGHIPPAGFGRDAREAVEAYRIRHPGVAGLWSEKGK